MFCGKATLIAKLLGGFVVIIYLLLVCLRCKRLAGKGIHRLSQQPVWDRLPTFKNLTLPQNQIFMKKVIAFVVLIIAGFSVYWFFLRTKDVEPKNEEKQEALVVKKHSAAFNTAIDNVMAAYFKMKDAFVDADTAQVKAHAATFVSLLDSIPVAELDKDSSRVSETAKANIEDIKSNTKSLMAQTDITEMRLDFRTVSDMLYPGFFKLINYEGSSLYLQNCPMAFDGDKDANWISNSNEVVNPYLGKNHPKYKGTMLHCGEVKDSLQ
ncbi:MAG: DUF3347 domain-containing protein [Chitinophagaceae bacterium]|nr:MAG: DUF3347 domain-containing protein [Chitinophagaceae bacterium]